VHARLTLVAAALALAASVGTHAAATPTGGSATADAAGVSTVELSRARAIKVLRRAQALIDERRPAAGDLTRTLMRLVRVYSSLDPAGRRAADRLLSRPTNRNDPEGNAWRAPEARSSPACSPNFCVHWVRRTGDAPRLADANGLADGDGIPDYVEATQLVAEKVFAVENGRLRWREPRSDRRRGGRRGKTDIYLSDLGTGFFGYAAPDLGQTTRQHRFRRSLHAYLVIDDDFRPAQFPGRSPLAYLRVTLAHEYNHVLQFSYDALQDLWLAESTATWMEDQVFDSVNDYLRYLKRWARRISVPITAASVRVYGSAVWNTWLQRRYGRDLIRRVWARAKRSRPAGFSVAAYGGAIRRAGRSGFNRDFARFARDLSEWRTARIFPEGRRYPDLPRRDRLAYGGGLTRYLNHTTFKLLRLRAARGRAVRVILRTPARTAAALALVGRIGGEKRGRVISRIRFAPRGGRLSLKLRRPGRFDRLTAVLVNADTRQRGFDPRRFDWAYTRNHVPFRVRARLLR
jgi:hypothetical protein